MPHGYYDVAFPLTLTPSVPGSVIRYTLNGSPPTPSSPVYSGPFTITPVAGTTRSGVRIVRAVATHPDAAYSPVATQTYFFVNGVSSPAVDGIVGQTNLFASIRNHATYGPLLDDALLALPSVVVGLLVYLLLSRSGPLGSWGILFTPTAMVIAQSILVVPLIAALARQLVADALSRPMQRPRTRWG